MIWWWAGQLALDAILISYLIYFYIRWRQQKHRLAQLEEQDQGTLSRVSQKLTARAEAWERQMQEIRGQVEVELVKLTRICERAHRLLNRANVNEALSSPSAEEVELVSVGKAESDKIPSVSEVEKIRQRLVSEPPPDLRSVLSDQLG